MRTFPMTFFFIYLEEKKLCLSYMFDFFKVQAVHFMDSDYGFQSWE